MARVTSVPNPHPERVVNFERLDGGLNLRELDYRLEGNQSAEMKNLWWQDGVLQCRDGQDYVYGPSQNQILDPLPEGVSQWTDLGTGYTCFSELFWDNAFFHISNKIYRLNLTSTLAAGDVTSMVEVASGIPENRGTFFRYNDWLFYKNVGGFFKITYDADGESQFTVTNVADEAYTPIILLNADPTTGSGDAYQPENRLSENKTVKYNAKNNLEYVSLTGNGSTKTFNLGKTSADMLTGVESVFFNLDLVSTALYTVDVAAGTITFSSAPANGITVTVVIQIGVVTYKLPVSLQPEEGATGSIVSVVVAGVEKVEGTDYAVDFQEGKVVFVTPPPVTNPPTNNTVAITYALANTEAYNSILECPYAAVYGGTANVSIVLGGCTAQPNAFFWSGNDSVSMNPAYWPMSFYNLAGDSEDGITGFGKQYGDLIVFKGRSVGKASFSVESIEERSSISLTYTAINDKIGCDLPWTIQLIENNLVFCNSASGVHVLKDSTAAYENNILDLSRNVNGTPQRPGLLKDISEANGGVICAFDDDNRYWIVANGKAYVWDYILSDWNKPSWFYLTNINGIAFFRGVDVSYHLNAQGRVTRFARVFLDYYQAIEKLYQFPPQNFGTYDRLKDVLYCIFTVRSDTDTSMQILYQSDYEERHDLTGIQVYSWRLSPRNLSYRCLAGQRFVHVARRKPGCRHVRHFSMRLYNNEPSQDLAIIAAQVYFKYLGRDR